MKHKYYNSDYKYLKNALLDASNWQKYILSEEEKDLPNDELVKLCLERCFDENVDIVDDLKDEIFDLEDQIRDFEKEIEDMEDEKYDLESELSESLLPNKTLDDLEKIEFIQQNWNKITYENLKKIV